MGAHDCCIPRSTNIPKAMLPPERLSASGWNAVASGSQQAAQHWLHQQTETGSAPLLLLIDGCLQCPESTLAAAWSLLSQQEAEHARTLQRREDQARHVIARACLRLLLGAITGKPPQELVIERNPSGKPFLASSEPAALTPEFNLSHSHDLVLIGLHHSHPIGVDLELHRALPECLEIAKQCFDGETVRQLTSLAGEQQLQAFYLAWCRLEADLKATGQGITQRPSANTHFSGHQIEMPLGYSGWASIFAKNHKTTMTHQPTQPVQKPNLD